MSAMRVCHVVESLAACDAARVAAAVATELPQADFVAEAIAFHDGPLGDLLRQRGLRVRVVGGRRRGALAAAWEAARLVDAARPDVVHLWDDGSRRRVGPLLSWRRRTKFVASLRQLPRDYEPWARRLDRFVLRRAAAVTADDSFIAERQRVVGGFDAAAPWPIIADGLVPPVIPTANRATVLAELGLPADVSFIASYVPRGGARDAKDVVWAAALLRNVYEDLRLVVIAEDDDIAPLRRFATAMDHDDRTVFVLDPAQFDRLASHAAVYLDGGYWTGPARAIVAAQAAGVPVVAVDTPIRRRLIDVDRTGYVAPHHDLEQLTRHAHRLLNDESLRATMSAAALNFASTQFPLRPMLDAYAGVYRRAAS